MEYRDADADGIDNWSETESGDGLVFNHTIKVNGVEVRPKAIAVQMTPDDYYAEIYFDKAGAEDFSEKIGAAGNPNHSASESLSWEEAVSRAEKYAENYSSAFEIRDSVNAPKSEDDVRGYQ